jgi:hypothetical protein
MNKNLVFSARVFRFDALPELFVDMDIELEEVVAI